MELTTDVLVIGAGGAGMYAAIAAAREGAKVLIADKNMIGRGGATVMAQMTVAAALAEQEPDRVEDHLDDTLRASRGLAVPDVAARLCADAPERMREMDRWGVGWARDGDRIRQVLAPGHGVKRCAYVDFLNTGPAVAGTLRKVVSKAPGIRSVSNLQITELVCDAGELRGAVGFELSRGEPVAISAGAVVIASGGLTRLFARSSASNNMLGDGFALALRAGASLSDMEFVQFFPIGHLAPRLVGMDPIMWDPFRYKLGGRLLNGQMQEFIHRYGGEDDGTYRATRDLATFAICQEVAAGRGSPSGGAFLSFTHVPESELRAAFGPVIDRLLANGIDLTDSPVEVSPIAHYHMGGIVVDETMRSTLPRLFAAGEAVAGAGGANRLSGNAISEALVFGEVAGRSAAQQAAREGTSPLTAAQLRAARDEPLGAAQARGPGEPPAQQLRDLREMMGRNVGPFRNRDGLLAALDWIRQARSAAATSTPPERQAYCNELADWHDLRNALLTAEAVVVAALHREESRGAHQRDDFPDTAPSFSNNQRLSMHDGRVVSGFDATQGIAT